MFIFYIKNEHIILKIKKMNVYLNNVQLKPKNEHFKNNTLR